MKKIWSGSKELDLETLKRVGRNALVFLTPVLLDLLTQIESWNIDLNALKLIISWLILDLIRRYLKDYTNIK